MSLAYVCIAPVAKGLNPLTVLGSDHIRIITMRYFFIFFYTNFDEVENYNLVTAAVPYRGLNPWIYCCDGNKA